MSRREDLSKPPTFKPDVKVGMTLEVNTDPMRKSLDYTENLYRQYLKALDDRDKAISMNEGRITEILVSSLWCGILIGATIVNLIYIIFG